MQIHSQEIERTRNSLEQQKTIDRMAINDKLQTAANIRDEHMKKILERLKEHVSEHIKYSNNNKSILNFN